MQSEKLSDLTKKYNPGSLKKINTSVLGHTWEVWEARVALGCRLDQLLRLPRQCSPNFPCIHNSIDAR